jgi:hypothetical protein
MVKSDLDDISQYLRTEFGAHEDSLQDAWVEILERNLQSPSEIAPVARKVRNKAIGQYLNRKYREESLQKPLGQGRNEGFTLESILPAPTLDGGGEAADAHGDDLYEKIIDFLVREYLKQRQENLDLRERRIELAVERIKLRKDALDFKKRRYESWRQLMVDKGRQKAELRRLHIQLQREKIELRKELLEFKKLRVNPPV